MKRRKMRLLIPVIILIQRLLSFPTQACSSFAYYGDQTFYGMNWDYYPGYDATFYIKSTGDMKVFNVFNKDGYDFTGMNTKGLFAAQQMVTPEEESGFYTLCSFLYEPETNSVYVAVDRDFDKLWKISIMEETAETFKGFESPMKIKIERGIKLSDLKELTYYNTQTIEAFEDLFIIKPAKDIELNEASKAYHKEISQKKVLMAGLFLIVPVCVILSFKRKKSNTKTVDQSSQKL